MEQEYKDLEEKIAYYTQLLSNWELLLQVLKDELIAIRDKFGDDRKTEIQDVEDEIDIEDLIEEESCCYTLSNAGYIKRMPASTYRAQKRGGRGISAQNLKEEDYVKNLFIASTHDYVLFFTNIGKVHRRKGYRIPEASRTARGTAIVNVLPLEPEEKVTAMLLTRREFDDEAYLVMATRNGTVKRLKLDALNTARRTGIRALSLEEGDELISVMKTSGEDNILIATANGMAICFGEQDVRPMGRGRRWRAGHSPGGRRLCGGRRDCRAQQAAFDRYGKGLRASARSFLIRYLRLAEDGTRQPQSRGGKGLKNYNLTDKTGLVAGVRVVSDEDDVMLIENSGIIVRRRRLRPSTSTSATPRASFSCGWRRATVSSPSSGWTERTPKTKTPVTDDGQQTQDEAAAASRKHRSEPG